MQNQYQFNYNPYPPENHQPPSLESLRKKRYKRYDKPPYTYQALISLAIRNSPNKMLRLSQILEQIKSMFPFFQGEYTGWKESVRHNLSQCNAFTQILRDPNRPQSKGNYWTVDITKIPPEQFRRQNTKVSRAVPPGFGYALDLRDIFNVDTGQIKSTVHVTPGLHPLLRPLHECKPTFTRQNFVSNYPVQQYPFVPQNMPVQMPNPYMHATPLQPPQQLLPALQKTFAAPQTTQPVYNSSNSSTPKKDSSKEVAETPLIVHVNNTECSSSPSTSPKPDNIDAHDLVKYF